MIQSKFQEILGITYSKLKKSRLSYWCFPKSVQNDIAALGKEEKTYYIQKMSYLGGFFLFVIGLVVLYFLKLAIGSTSQINTIDRPKVYEETQQIVVQAGRQNDVYELEIAPITLTKEQADVMLCEVVDLLDTYILGDNQSLEYVTDNLFLPAKVSEYPFEIYWESDKESIVDTFGTVNREGLFEDEVVVLTAVFQYGDWIWEEQFGILVCKEVLSEEEEYERHLGYLLKDSEKNQRSASTWELPGTFQGEQLDIKVVEDDYTILILGGLVLAAAVAVWIGQDYDLHTSREKRKEEFQYEYVSFAGSLSMYLSAGITLQTAMQYCIRDYMKRKPKKHLLRIALQEFQRDLQNGCGFSEAMELFAAKTDDINYKRLAGLLNQGIINGTQGMAGVLEQEVEKVREEKRRQSKIKGEQVSTALIAPMMLQLGIIIALIMIPAFTNMQF